MIWKDYSYLSGKHAFLSPSKYHWLNYDPAKLVMTYNNYKKVSLGTKYHVLAADLIRLAVRLPNTAASFNCFVNDAIGFKMSPEKMLFYSHNCYGTADAISFHNDVLRIHDLKTGMSPGSMNQLLIYAGLFCLDYDVEPSQIHLRIYQHDEVTQFEPSMPDVMDVMSTIIESDKIIDRLATDNLL